jgi:hypothetical protein
MMQSASSFCRAVRSCTLLVPLAPMAMTMAMAVSSVGCGGSDQSGPEVVAVPEQTKAANNAMEDFMKNKAKAKAKK